MTTQEKVQGYWFSNKDERLRYGDDRLVEVGTTHEVRGRIQFCTNGLHFCENVLDALEYAPGTILWRIEAWGDLILGKDKGVARYRTYLWRLDASTLLERFTRECVLSVAHFWNAPDFAIEYLTTGDESLRLKTNDAAGEAFRGSNNNIVEYWASCAVIDSISSYRAAIYSATRAISIANKEDLKEIRKKQEQRLLTMIEEALQAQAHVLSNT